MKSVYVLAHYFHGLTEPQIQNFEPQIQKNSQTNSTTKLFKKKKIHKYMSTKFTFRRNHKDFKPTKIYNTTVGSYLFSHRE